jgi:alkylation response protein AidB-like acyl-CoA dehydrogenase
LVRRAFRIQGRRTRIFAVRELLPVARYTREYWVERAACDARLGPIGWGPDEIMHEILGRVLAL